MKNAGLNEEPSKKNKEQKHKEQRTDSAGQTLKFFGLCSSFFVLCSFWWAYYYRRDFASKASIDSCIRCAKAVSNATPSPMSRRRFVIAIGPAPSSRRRTAQAL